MKSRFRYLWLKVRLLIPLLWSCRRGNLNESRKRPAIAARVGGPLLSDPDRIGLIFV